MLFPLFVVITLLEIYVLVLVGQSIGAFSTIFLVVITALIGSTLLKQQGLSTLKKVQQKSAQGQTPGVEMLEGVVILVSGVLLLTPGFVTDIVGLLGLMPWSRNLMIGKISNHSEVIFAQKTTQFSPRRSVQNQNNTIEGEFWEE